MADRPILFSAPMVRALLDGRKSMTRRVFIPPTPFDPFDDITIELATGSIKPRYQVGDRLWVRETWCPVNDEQFGESNWTDYRATPRYGASHPAGWDNAPNDPDALKWRPSIFMPRWASRLTQIVTDVRVQRLQDISNDDAEAEGIESEAWDQAAAYRDYGYVPTDQIQRRSYQSLWDRLNAKRGYGWDTNPWVTALTFTVHHCNIDELANPEARE